MESLILLMLSVILFMRRPAVAPPEPSPTPTAEIVVTPAPTPEATPTPTVPSKPPAAVAKPSTATGDPQATVDLVLAIGSMGMFNKGQSSKDLGNPPNLDFFPRNGASIGYFRKIEDPQKFANVATIWGAIKNEGSEPAYNVPYEAYYDGVLIGTVTKDRIDQGTMHSMKIAEMPLHVLGKHTITVRTNSARSVKEKSYTNNESSFTYIVVEASTKIAPDGTVFP